MGFTMQTFAAISLAAMLILGPTPAVAATPPEQGAAQQPATLHELVLRDGTRIIGTIESETPERVVIRTTGGARVEALRTEIVSLNPVRGQQRDGGFLRADPNPTRLFFGPTGRTIKRGEAYIGVYELFLPFVQVGITDHISIGGGTPLYVGGGSDRPFWITPKLQIHDTGRVATSIGAMHFLNVDDINLGIAYAATTIGTTDDAVTVGVGWAYANTNSNNEGAVVAMLGGERRISPRFKLITENYVFNGGGILSGGIRFLGDSLSADLGLFVPLGAGGFVALPIVNFVWKF
jgi:hypothetical protein